MSKNFDQLLTESFSAASYLDVSELRALYYGRLDLFVSFTDDSRYVEDGDGTRPAGIVSYRVEDVVGRKASSSDFYAYVFRVKKSSGRFLEDIRNYTNEDLIKDLRLIEQLPYVFEDDFELVKKSVTKNSLLRRPFERLWEAGRILSGAKDEIWARIYKDIGYIAFNDPSGTGILIRRRSPVCLLLDTKAKTDLDIVPIQKYRVDRRRRIVDDVNRTVARLRTKRNRVSKRTTAPHRGIKKTGDGFFDLLGKISIISSIV